jgi:DNA-binding response OmpR family regulator
MVASVLDAGADDYLTKPTPSRVLVAHIKRLVDRKGSAVSMNQNLPGTLPAS